MTRLTVLTAAFAAGMTTFAANAQVAHDMDMNAIWERAGKTLPARADQTGATFHARNESTAQAQYKASGESENAAAGEVASKQAEQAPAEREAVEPVKPETETASAEPFKPIHYWNAQEQSGASMFGGADGSASAAIDKITTAAIPAEKKAAVANSAYSSIIAKYASMHGVPVSLANAVIRIESNFRADARGSAGEIGLMQIKPSTARMMGYSGSTKNLYNPDTNIRYGMMYLAKAHQLGGGDTCGTILRYNAGHAATRMNKISAAYCAKVKRHLGGA